jgi:hypothetical protein
MKAIVTALALVCAGAPAHAQAFTWTGLDGSISITFPDGWRRLDEMMRSRFPGSVEPEVLLQMDKGDAIQGQPGVNCELKASSAALPAGQTADMVNQRTLSQAASAKAPDQPGVAKTTKVVGNIMVIETDRLDGGRDDLMIWQTGYARGSKVYLPNIICRPNVVKTGITPNDVKDVRAMFDAIKVSLK